jgi:hypothetical protein
MKSIAPALALLLGTLGTLATSPAAALERPGDELRTLRATTSRGQNPAVLALLDSAVGELAAGRPEQASALLERALRIEPRNPTAWHYLGVANLELGKPTQAEAMAAKSRSLVAGDRGLRDWASRTLIEPARTYVDSGRERPAGTEQRRWPPVEAAAQAWRDVRALTSRDRAVATERARREQADRVRREQAERVREQAAQREERIQQRAAAESERRYRNRRGSNEGVRRSQQL